MLATQTTADTVAITRTFDGIEEATHRIIEQVGGMASVIRGAKYALLKPNLVAGRSAETGSTTSFALMKAVAEEVRACGAEPLLCETPGTEFDREATYTILGIEQFCEEQGIVSCVSIPKEARLIGWHCTPLARRRCATSTCHVFCRKLV